MRTGNIDNVKPRRHHLVFVSLLLWHMASPLAVAQGKHLFILSGQSNMVGHRPQEAFLPAVEKALGKENVIVVQHAVGGQSIQRWYKKWTSPQGVKPAITGDIYDQLMGKVNPFIRGKTLESVTFIWMQGEKDTQKWGSVYAVSLKGLHDQLNKDLERKDVNFVIGRISDHDLQNNSRPHWTMVREAQVKVAESDPRFKWVNTDDLNDGLNRRGRLIRNDLHYSAEGYKTLGSRFAESALKLIKLHSSRVAGTPTRGKGAAFSPSGPANNRLAIRLAGKPRTNKSVGKTHSDLWGKDGEKWSPESRLPDFSFAGYHCGEDPLPNEKVTTDVLRFGAKGDGRTDSTQAFREAIDETEKGVILIPAGRYIISDIIWITKPGIVLRGAGQGKTIIVCPKTLEDVRPNMGANSGGKPTSGYSWSGGFLWAKGSIKQNKIASISEDCKRGSRELKIEKTTKTLRKGQRITIEMKDDAQKTLLNHIYSGDSGDTAKISKQTIRMVNRVVSASGTSVTLERPLRLDIRKSWSPVLKTYEPTVSEVGIEELSIEFPVKPYPGHNFTERGMNGIAMNRVADCWVRNVQISNSDSGIFLDGDFCTADGVVLDSKRSEEKGTTGHHGILLGQDCLVQNFEFKTHFVHDFTLNYAKSGNVVKNGKGINLSLDHHKIGPFENLFCNIDVGKGGEIWLSGGGGSLGKHCGARGTFWCIKSQDNIDWPPLRFGPDSMNIVGVKTSTKSTKDPKGKWFEAIAPEQLQPADLHASQLARRLKK